MLQITFSKNYNYSDELSALFVYSLTNNQELIIPQRLKKIYKQNFIKNMHIISELKKIYKICENMNIRQPILLKGTSYIFKFYNDNLGCRNLNDIDLLIYDKEHYFQLCELLKSNGYIFSSDYPETLTKNNIKIDLHIELINSARIAARREFVNISDWQKHIIKINDFYFLDDNLDFLYSLLHSAIHHSFSEFKWLTDAYLFIFLKKLAPQNLKKIAEINNILDLLRFCLTYLNLIFELPQEYQDTFNLPYKKNVCKYILKKTNKKNCQYLINFLFANNLQKIRILMNLLFPNKTILNLKYLQKNILAQYIQHYKEIIKSVI